MTISSEQEAAAAAVAAEESRNNEGKDSPGADPDTTAETVTIDKAEVCICVVLFLLAAYIAQGCLL